MKKILFLLSFLFVFAASQAQTVYTSQYSNATDTVTNTATKYLTSPINNENYQNFLVVVVNVDKISGTVGGTVTLQYSIDGSIWYDVDTAKTLTDVSNQVVSFTESDFVARNVRIKATGSGTMSAKYSVKSVFKRPHN